MKRLGFLVALFAIAAVPAVQAQGGNVPAVSGRVFDDTTGCPLRGVRLTAVGTSAATVSDINGRYRLRGVPTTPFTLEAALAGYASKSSDGVIAADTTLRVDFSLIRAMGDTGKMRPRYPVARCVLDRKDSGGV
ncbi:MAG: carboxypeptidase regulatory-like domain-containing protein [Gemmatimonadota bacterium]